MSTSLPRIRAISQQNDPQIPTHVKFKKLKLGTQIYQEEKIKNIIKPQPRTQRLLSLQRHTSIQQLRQAKNQKIHLNLLQRKLLTGRYDQTYQTGNDLNKLKLKTDQFKTEGKIKFQETQKLRRLLHQTKKQIETYVNQRKKIQDQINQLQNKYQVNKDKVQVTKFDRGIYQHMIRKRQAVNIFLSGQINNNRTYLEKLISFDGVFDKELRDISDRLKLVQSECQKTKQHIDSQRQQRQYHMLQSKQKISRRAQTQNNRSERAKNLLDIIDKVENQQKQKQFDQIYHKILSYKFFDKFMKFEFQRLYTHHQQMEKQYSKICSFGKFLYEQPQNMSKRFLEHKPQAKQLQKIIKEKQLEIEKLENQSKLLNKKFIQVHSQSFQIDGFTSLDLVNQKFKNELMEEKEKRDKINLIKKWIGKYLNILKIKANKNPSIESIKSNFENIAQTVKSQINRNSSK